MKTPREILFERHRQAGPRLDAVRRKALAGLTTAENADAFRPARTDGLSAGGILRKAWRELIVPHRRAWAAMAAVWFALVAANLQMKAGSRGMPAAPARDVVQAFNEQRRLLAELPDMLQAATPPRAKPERPTAQPRSERRVHSKAC
jgi:hypothetical protein